MRAIHKTYKTTQGIALTAWIFMLLFSCDSDSGTPYFKSKFESTVIASGTLYGAGEEGIEKQNLVILDEIEWNDLLIQMNSVNDVSYQFSEIDIDFSVYKVIAVFDEVKPNAGHSIELNVSSKMENIVVEVTYSFSEVNNTPVVVQPFHIVKITNTDLPIQFEYTN